MELETKSDQCTRHINFISKGLENNSDFYIAKEDEYNDIHDLLETESMDLSGDVKLKYSRRPDLFSSYLESGQIPAIITDEKKKFLGVVSEMDISRFGECSKIYYTSDLRISKQAGMRTRANFRKAYLEVLKTLPNDCFTVVLKDNEKAIQALTRNQSDLYYNKVYEYLSRAILILPSINFLPEPKHNLEIVEGSDDNFKSNLQSRSSFSNTVSKNDKSFIIKEKGKTVAQFSICRPALRSLFIEAQSKKKKFWLKAVKTLFSHDYERKIPWVYLTSLYLGPGQDKESVIKKIIKYLYSKKELNTGELFLLCHGAREQLRLRLPLPQFLTYGNLYKVSDCNYTEELVEPIHLNPLSL